jgi:MarR family transcriptional regulator for hemolysin
MGQGFEYDLFFLLHDVARLIRVEADKRARTHGMTRAQWALLLRLSCHPGLSQKEAADLLEVEPISVARLVDRLVALGLIERRADEQDRRVWRLHLLPAATAMLEEINRHRVAIADFVGDGLSAETRAAMVQGLQRMKANLLLAPEHAEQQDQPAETLEETR